MKHCHVWKYGIVLKFVNFISMKEILIYSISLEYYYDGCQSNIIMYDDRIRKIISILFSVLSLLEVLAKVLLFVPICTHI